MVSSFSLNTIISCPDMHSVEFGLISTEFHNYNKSDVLSLKYYSLNTLIYLFGPVFHVTDQLGNKITDEGLIAYIQKVSNYQTDYHLSVNVYDHMTLGSDDICLSV